MSQNNIIYFKMISMLLSFIFFFNFLFYKWNQCRKCWSLNHMRSGWNCKRNQPLNCGSDCISMFYFWDLEWNSYGGELVHLIDQLPSTRIANFIIVNFFLIKICQIEFTLQFLVPVKYSSLWEVEWSCRECSSNISIRFRL